MNFNWIIKLAFKFEIYECFSFSNTFSRIYERDIETKKGGIRKMV